MYSVMQTVFSPYYTKVYYFMEKYRGLYSNLPIFFLEQSNLDYKIPHTKISVTHLPVISVLKTRCFPWVH